MKKSLRQIARENNVSNVAVGKIKRREKLTTNIDLALDISKVTGLPFWEHVSNKVLGEYMRILLRKKKVYILDSDLKKVELQLIINEKNKKRLELEKQRAEVVQKVNEMQSKDENYIFAPEYKDLENKFHSLDKKIKILMAEEFKSERKLKEIELT